MEQITIVGRLGKDAEIREHNGQVYTNLSVAVNAGFKNKEGNWVDRTNWYNCTVWREVKADVYRKGNTVFLQGIPTLRTLTLQDGTVVPSISIRVDHYRVIATAAYNQQPQQPNDTDQMPY